MVSAHQKKIIILVIAAAVVACLIYFFSLNKKAGKIHTGISYSTLEKTTLQDTVSVSGTVQSNDSTNVYTTLTLPVQKVNVSVGDKVKKGEVLAVLDTSSLLKDIEQQEDTNKSADTANSLALQKAQSDYTSALSQYNNDSSTAALTAKSQADSAKSALDAEASTYNYDQFLYKNGQLSKMALDQEQTKYSGAQSAYNSAKRALDAARDQAKQSVDAAKNAYDTAIAKSTDKSQQVALEKLQENLQDATIVAPADGTVTFKNCGVGSIPNGVLFRVENPSDLIVNCQVKEIDTAKMRPGDKVSITSDATGADKIAGIVENIAPAASEKTQGTGDVTFSTKVRVIGKNPDLKIGMKAKMSIVMQEKPNVYVVSYDSILTNSNGSSSVVVAQKNGSLYQAKIIPVKTGMETDVSVEISGSGLTDGMKILNSPEGIAAGDTLQLSNGNANGSSSQAS